MPLIYGRDCHLEWPLESQTVSVQFARLPGFFSGIFAANTGDICNQGHLGFQVDHRPLNRRRFSISQHSWVNMLYLEHLQASLHSPEI